MHLYKSCDSTFITLQINLSSSKSTPTRVVAFRDLILTACYILWSSKSNNGFFLKRLITLNNIVANVNMFLNDIQQVLE